MSVPPVGGNVSVIGNTATPGNVVISVTSKSAIELLCVANLTISGLKLQTTTSGHGIRCTVGGGLISVGAGMQFGACAQSHMQATNGGAISCFSAYTINGSAQWHALTQTGGGVTMFGQTVTLSGTPAFTQAFVASSLLGFVSIASITYSGAATGVRYSASGNGVINTSGGGASFFPGNTAGTTSTGGQYA
jgi:hypothetical protein